jgi:TM2 domain-containing membrane protein YozV
MTGKKRPILAAALSFLIPGLGQVYNKERRKSMGFFLIGSIFIMLEIFLISNKDKGRELGPILVAAISIILFWIYNIYDAYNTAERKVDENL